MSENTVASSETITEWCSVEKLSKAAFYDLPPDLRPKTLEIPGTRIIRVIEPHDAWRARMAVAMQAKAARLETQRRRMLASIAGKIAAQSPKHVSRRRQNDARRARGRARG